MTDARTRRISRELCVAAVGETLGVLEPWVIDRLTAALEEVEVGAGESVYSIGDAPDYFYVARQGRLALLRDGKPVETVDGPRAFGMLDGLAERPRSHSVVARVPLQLLRIRLDAWLELLEDSFELARTSVLRLAADVSALEERAWARGRSRPLTAPPAPRPGEPRLDSVARLALLMSTAPLRGAGAQPLSDLATVSHEVAFVAGQRLFERGASPARVFVLIDGRVDASREAPDVTWQGGPGQTVCGVTAFTDRALAWDARAVGRGRALTFAIEDWFDVLEENFEMVRATLATLATEHDRLVAEL